MDTTSTPADVAAFLDRYANALVSGDLPGIAACYALPALVVGDAGAIPVSEPARVEAAFAGAADAYRAQGMVGIQPSCAPSTP
jgi:ketosteroid isomerase-like protein